MVTNLYLDSSYVMFLFSQYKLTDAAFQDTVM